MKRMNSIRTGMLFLSTEKAINGTLTLILMPFIIRAIGIEQYGLWAILLGIFSYLQFLDLGISFSLERFIAFHNAKNDNAAIVNHIRTSLTYMLLYSLFLFFLITFAGRGIVQLFTNRSCPPEHAGVLLRLYPALAAAILQPVFMGIPRGLQRFDISSKIQISGKIIFVLAFIIGAPILHNINALIIAFSLQNCFTLVAYIVAARKLMPGVPLLRLGILTKTFREQFNFGIKIQISSIAFLVTQHFDKILLSSFYGLRFAGYYEAATRIIYAIRDIPLFLMSVLTPRITELIARNDRDSIAELYKKITGQLSMISFLLMALLFINRQTLLTFVLKTTPDRFTVIVFSVICLSSFWHVISGSATYASRGMGKTSIEMYANIFTLLINVTFSLLLMKQFSINGIVLGTGIALLTSPLLSYILTNRLFGTRTVPFFLSSFLQPLIITVIVIFLSTALLHYLATRMDTMIAALIVTTFGFVVTNGFYFITGNRIYREFIGMGLTLLWRRTAPTST